MTKTTPAWIRPSVCSPSLGSLGQPEPEHVHRRAEILDLQPGAHPHIGVAAIGADDEIGPDLERTLRRLGMKTKHTAMLHDEVGDARAHLEMKARVAARLLGEEIEKVPLRHQGDEAAMRRQMREVCNDDPLVADQTRKLAHLLVRAFEEGVENAELVHDLERGGMDGVAAKVAQEIGVLLQHHDVDAGAGQQEAEHHAGRTAAGNGAGRGYLLRHDYPPASTMALR